MLLDHEAQLLGGGYGHATAGFCGSREVPLFTIAGEGGRAVGDCARPRQGPAAIDWNALSSAAYLRPKLSHSEIRPLLCSAIAARTRCLCCTGRCLSASRSPRAAFGMLRGPGSFGEVWAMAAS